MLLVVDTSNQCSLSPPTTGCPRSDQRGDLRHHGRLHAASVWFGARLGAFQPDLDIRPADSVVLLHHGTSLPGQDPSATFLAELGGPRKPGGPLGSGALPAGQLPKLFAYDCGCVFLVQR